MLRVGDQAPDFEGTDQQGNRISLAELAKESAVVLYFYPKDFTRVCTQQACMFRDAFEKLKGKDAVIVGVSVDSAETHARFSNEHGLPFSLVADRDKKIAKDYGALQILGLFAKRVTYLIDRDRIVRGVYHHELSANKHLADVEAGLAALGAA